MIEKTTRKPDYTTAQVRWILENYLTLAEGKPPASGLAGPDCGSRIHKSPSLKAVYEKPVQLKADIDRAMQSLRSTERAIIIAVCISGLSYYEVAYWWDQDPLEIRSIEEYSIRKIKRVLNRGRVNCIIVDGKLSLKEDCSGDENVERKRYRENTG